MSFKKSKEKDLKVVEESIGFPYNKIPKGYPNKLFNKDINKTINIFLDNLKSNAGVNSIVNTDYTLIRLGLDEINKRENTFTRIISIIALICSMISGIFTGIALILN